MAKIEIDDVTVDLPLKSDRQLSIAKYMDRAAARLLTGIKETVRAREAPRSGIGGAIETDSRGRTHVRALRNVSFSLKDGDRLAVIGANGAGKSTLLRVLGRIYEPTAGRVRIEGEVKTLFNIHVGMAPDATGVELIKLRCHLFGYDDDQVEEITEDVEKFCELGEYLNMPVRVYSTGMVVRLAFAIITAVPGEILLLDEVIGAGDAAFVERAESRLKSFFQRSSVIVIASHNYAILQEWCNRACLLEHGAITFEGGVDDTLHAYNVSMGRI